VRDLGTHATLAFSTWLVKRIYLDTHRKYIESQRPMETV